MSFYIPDTICFRDDTGIMLSSDTHGFVCHLFEPEPIDSKHIFHGTHLEYTILPDLYETEKDARNVNDTHEVVGDAQYDVVFVEKDNKWAILHCDLYPNLATGSSFLHVEFYDKSEGNRMFRCKFRHTIPCTPRGFSDLRQLIE